MDVSTEFHEDTCPQICCKIPEMIPHRHIADSLWQIPILPASDFPIRHYGRHRVPVSFPMARYRNLNILRTKYLNHFK